MKPWLPVITILLLLSGGCTRSAPLPAGARPTAVMTPPATPTLAQLRGLALDSITFSPDGKRQVELFLYDPDVRYTLTDTPSCASLTGQVDADGQHWSFWASSDGGPPVPAGDIGAYEFPGERGLAADTTTVGDTTYLYLEQYSGCANAHVQHVFAFDHAAQTVWRPQMKLETGETVGALGRVGDDGKLHRDYYDNAKEPGLHRLIYGWDAQAKLWTTESHEHPQK